MIRKFLVVLFLLSTVVQVSADERTAGGSASIQNINKGPIAQRVSQRDIFLETNKKKRAIKSILARSNSPMTESVDTFLHTCVTYNFDCYFLPAITGLESGFGHYILQGSYNPFGWNGGYEYFSDWDHAIQSVGAGIQDRYIQAGLFTVEEIGTRYASSPTWAIRVRGFMAQFKNEEEKNSLYLKNSDLQL